MGVWTKPGKIIQVEQRFWMETSDQRVQVSFVTAPHPRVSEGDVVMVFGDNDGKGTFIAEQIKMRNRKRRNIFLTIMLVLFLLFFWGFTAAAKARQIGDETGFADLAFLVLFVGFVVAWVWKGQWPLRKWRPS
jgi:hypothetical protein